MDTFEKYINSFKGIGFSTNEAKVYLTLIKYGSCKAGNIAKYTNLDRGSVYNNIQSLQNKGLVSFITIGKTRWFQCSSSNNIISFLNNRLEQAKEFLPQLEKIRNETKLKENVSMYKGFKGIRSVFEDILNNAEENLIFGSEGLFSKNMPLFAKQFTQKLEIKGIKIRSIIRTDRNIEVEKKKNVRRIPSNTPSPVVTNIYKNKIAIIVWGEKPEGILIENQKAADAYKEYFNFMWEHAKE